MASAVVDVIAPRELIIPDRAASAQLSTAKKGTIQLSGAKLAFFDGTNWTQITSA